MGALLLALCVTVSHYCCLSPCPGAYGLSGECGWAQWDPWDWTAVADRAGWCPFWASRLFTVPWLWRCCRPLSRNYVTLYVLVGLYWISVEAVDLSGNFSTFLSHSTLVFLASWFLLLVVTSRGFWADVGSYNIINTLHCLKSGDLGDFDGSGGVHTQQYI